MSAASSRINLIVEQLLEARGCNDRLGRCYELSAQYITGADDPTLLFKGGRKDWTLVHGIIRSRQLGKELVHAWVEKGNIVYDPVVQKKYDRRVWYALMDVHTTVKYSSQQARQELVRHGHYGPWDSHLRNFRPKGFSQDEIDAAGGFPK